VGAVTYPEPVYTGPGEHTATFRPGGTPRELEYGNGSGARYLATGASTAGQFGLYRWEMGPQARGPAPHLHRAISESFYVLDGVVQIFDGERWHDAHPGDFAHVPAGGVHAFRNESGAPAAMLLHFAPGAPREDYFETLPRLGEMSDEEREAFFVRHDTYWL
jgi:mannose-6-phosphate isomerase-like protein (cupin superfamily)